MFCSKCGKEIPDESIYCPYCGEELTEGIKENAEQQSQKIDNEIESKLENKKIIKVSLKKAIIITLVFLLLMSIISVAIVFINKKSKNNIQNTNTNNEEIKQNTEKVKEDIPEEEKVMVLFMDNSGQRTLEERRITNREQLVTYNTSALNKLKTDMVYSDWGLYEKSGAIYYIEYDFNQQKQSIYGGMIFGTFFRSNYSGVNTRVIGVIWDSFNEANQNYSNVYDSGAAKIVNLNAEKGKANSIIGSEFINILTQFYGLDSSNYTNVRIGTIGVENNPWIQEIVNSESSNNTETNNQVDDEEVTANPDYEEMMSSQSSSNNNSDNSSSNSTNNSQNNTNVNSNQSNNSEEQVSLTIYASNDNTSSQNYRLDVTVDIDTYDSNIWQKEAERLSATVNGKTMKKSLEGGTISFSSDEKLSIGTNNFTITVTNNNGVTKTKNCTVTFEPPKPKIGCFVLDNRIDINITTEGLSELEVSTIKINGEVVASNTSSYTYYKEEGKNSCTIVVIDKYGQEVSKTVSF